MLSSTYAPFSHAKEQDRNQRNPTTNAMHYHRACEVVKSYAKLTFKPGLNAKIAVPDDAFKQRVNQTDGKEGRNQYWIESSSLGDTTRNNRRNCRSKSQQKKNLTNSYPLPCDKVLASARKVPP